MILLEPSKPAASKTFSNLIFCRIFELFALQMDPVTEFIKLKSAPFKEGTTLVPKLAGSTFLLEKQLHPL
jgi:hypothetical protein